MFCLSLGWLEHILIWAVIVIAIFSIAKILIAVVFSRLGEMGFILAQILNIIIYVVIALFIIAISFDIIQCLITYIPKV